MNIRITEVISDITGVSGMKMIEAILNGEKNRQTLMDLFLPISFVLRIEAAPPRLAWVLRIARSRTSR